MLKYLSVDINFAHFSANLSDINGNSEYREGRSNKITNAKGALPAIMNMIPFVSLCIFDTFN